MANYERGYEQSDEVRVYDGAEDEDDEEGSRLPILIVMALLVLAAFGGVVWLAYERGVASGRTEPRIITAEQGPVKVAPPASANASDNPYKGLKIYEQPAPNDEEAGAAETNTTSASAPPPAAKPATTMAVAPTPATTAPPVAIAPKPATPKPVVAKPAPVQMATASPPAATVVKPATATVTRPVAPAAAKPVPPVDLPVATASNAATAAPPTPAAAKPAAPAANDASTNPAPAGAYLLQIGAYKSQAEADASWKAFAAKHAALLAGFSPNVKQVDLGDKGTWYRLRLGSFADKDAANALCERLKTDGGNCFLAK